MRCRNPDRSGNTKARIEQLKELKFQVRRSFWFSFPWLEKEGKAINIISSTFTYRNLESTAKCSKIASETAEIQDKVRSFLHYNISSEKVSSFIWLLHEIPSFLPHTPLGIIHSWEKAQISAETTGKIPGQGILFGLFFLAAFVIFKARRERERERFGLERLKLSAEVRLSIWSFFLFAGRSKS